MAFIKQLVDEDNENIYPVTVTEAITDALGNSLDQIISDMIEDPVNADWDAIEGPAQILNKPTLGSLAAKSAIVTTDITNANVTDAKLANMAAYTVKGRNASDTGVPADVTMLDAAEYALHQGTVTTAPADTDFIPISVSTTSLKKITWENVKATLKTYFDDLYLALSGGTVTGVVSITNATASTSKTTGALKVTGGVGIGGNVYATNMYGAVWNDYAEYREGPDNVIPGQVVIEKGDDTVLLSHTRLLPGAMIVTDTFGFAIGQTEKALLPIAVSGRVLAYPYENRDSYAAGDPVCSGPDGTVSKMTREECINFPERILGTVSAIPNYEEWGTGNIKVGNRIWIRVL